MSMAEHFHIKIVVITADITHTIDMERWMDEWSGLQRKAAMRLGRGPEGYHGLTAT
jgi:hypothetical protein